MAKETKDKGKLDSFGKVITFEEVKKAYPKNAEEVYDALASAGGYGKFPKRDATLAIPKEGETRDKLEETLAKF